MFYTSGSTGVPKGVVILQRNVVNLLEWIHYCEFQLSPSDVFLLQTSISFDPFCEVVVWHVSSSCFFLVIPDNLDRDIEYMNLRIGDVSVVDMTPSMFSVLRWDDSSLKLAFLGGEPITAGCLSKSAAEIWNGYGPTETTVFVSANPWVRTRRTIGRPLFNVSFSVSDSEICISGKSVGSGYMGLQGPTRFVFLLDLMANDGSSTLYRTGDSGKFCVDRGDMMYCHRLDDQVKISGQRVELGAVESAVLACAGVAQCAVLVMEASGAMKSLAAVYVGSASVSDVKNELRRRGSLARHEMPQQVVRVAEIPLTRAGKADRRALRAQVGQEARGATDETARAERASDEARPAKKSDESVRSVVQEAFGEVMGGMMGGSGEGKSVASFWELGGTSLMGMALDGLLQRRTGVKVGIGRLMRDGTVEAIAQTIETEQLQQQQQTEASHEQSGGKAATRETASSSSSSSSSSWSGMFWASAGQAGMYVAWKMEEEPKNAYTVSQVFEVAQQERLDVRRVAAAVAGLTRLHETLRTRFVEVEGRVMQVVEAETKVDVEVVEVESGEEREVVARRAGRHAFDLRRGPLLRVTVVRSRSGGSELVVFVMPHICYDHGSERRLFGDFVKLYRGRREDERELSTTSMREFVAWEERMLAERGSVLEAFWKKELGGAALNRIPGTRVCGEGRRHEEARVQSIRWSKEVRERMQRWMRGHGWRQVSVLHAALAALVGRLTGDESVVLAIALSQRGGAASGTEVVGYLMNMVWVRYRVGGDGLWASVAEYVDDCQRRISEAFEHGDYPLGLVWRAAGFGEIGGEEVTVALDVVPEFPSDETDELLRESGIETPQLPPNMIQFFGRAARQGGRRGNQRQCRKFY